MFDLDLDEGVALVVRSVADAAPLLPAETEAISNRAVERRRADFAAGRAAARQALVELGLPPVPLTKGPAGDPQWPTGVVGSIAHAEGWAVAMATTTARSGGVGIDLEASARYFPELVAEVAFDAERERIESLSGEERARAAVAVFAAKESIYKAFYPRVGEIFGFDAVRLTPGGDGYSSAFAVALDPAYPPDRPFEVRVRWFGDLVVTWLVLPPD